MFPSSITLTALGAALLWFGWFGFNAGSQLAADGVAGSAFLVTNTSAAMGALAWMFAEWWVTRQADGAGNRLGDRGRGWWPSPPQRASWTSWPRWSSGWWPACWLPVCRQTQAPPGL